MQLMPTTWKTVCANGKPCFQGFHKANPLLPSLLVLSESRLPSVMLSYQKMARQKKVTQCQVQINNNKWIDYLTTNHIHQIEKGFDYLIKWHTIYAYMEHIMLQICNQMYCSDHLRWVGLWSKLWCTCLQSYTRLAANVNFNNKPCTSCLSLVHSILYLVNINGKHGLSNLQQHSLEVFKNKQFQMNITSTIIPTCANLTCYNCSSDP